MEPVLLPRQREILLTLIKEFITTAEAVGSATLTRKYNISASPATIRSEMAKLEEMGYLYQPHTSAGRVPTDKAYRYYVNHLMSGRISPPDDIKPALEEFEHYEAQVQRLLEHTGRILADLTHYTSLVLAPRLRRTMFKYLKLAPLEDNRIIIIMMTNTGAIINKVIQVDEPLFPENLERMTNILNERLSGLYLEEIGLDFLTALKDDLQGEILRHLSLLTRETILNDENSLIYDGAVNLFDLPEFQNIDKLKIIIELLEEEKVVADILKKTLINEGLKVFIGSEHRLDPMKECSFITASYEIGGVPVGSIGVMGPTRMPYKRIIPVVSALADVFSKKMTKLSDIKNK